MNELKFERHNNRLVWADSQYAAVSGPWGKPLPSGRYRVEVRNAVVGGSLSSSYRDRKTGHAWFIPITPLFNTNRGGFGIHPDGNVAGTLGCIGLTGDACERFWVRWNSTPMVKRPNFLAVT